MDINVEYYQTGTGRSPVQEFLDSLNPKMHDKMKLSIGLLKEHGIHLRAPYSKPIRDGLFELRARIGTNLSRIVYYWNSKCSVVFLCGFIKKRSEAFYEGAHVFQAAPQDAYRNRQTTGKENALCVFQQILTEIITVRASSTLCSSISRSSLSESTSFQAHPPKLSSVAFAAFSLSSTVQNPSCSVTISMLLVVFAKNTMGTF